VVHPDARALITQLGMTPISREGGWFRETWRSRLLFPAGSLPGYGVDKPAGTAILALFTDAEDGFSALHRLPTPEVWHFCSGDPFALLLLHSDATSEYVVLGPEPLSGQLVQLTVPAGTWMGGRVSSGGGYTLVGCTMAPGFTEDDLEMGVQEELVRVYPDRAGDIVRLSRPLARH
jgi:predicted cupin superfamily sugar epimerase